MMKNQTQYKTIYADPWLHRNPVPDREKIASMRVGEIAHQNSVLFLWVPVPLLTDGIYVMEQWGYKYKGALIWNKIGRIGLGAWWRNSAEILLFGVSGNVKAFRSLIRNVVEWPADKHSGKPSYFRDIISSMTDELQPRIELFAQGKAPPGWDVWGSEAEGSIDFPLVRE